MRKYLSYFALLITVAGILNACQKTILPSTPTQSDNSVDLSATVPVIVETSPAILTPVPGKISTNILGYYEALPAHYKQTSQKYPVIFFFHGGGQYGDGHTHLDTVLSDGIPRLLRDKKFPPSFTVGTKVFSFIVIMPQQVRPAQDYEIAAWSTMPRLSTASIPPACIFPDSAWEAVRLLTMPHISLAALRQ